MRHRPHHDIITYTYDAVDNRVFRTVCVGAPPCMPATTHYTYDTASRLITASG